MSYYDDAKTISLMSGAAGKDGKIYNVKPDGALGSETIINGTFDTDSDWIKGSGFSISGGVASCDGTQTAATNLHNSAGNGLVDGKTYRVEYTITSYSAGSVRVKAGNTGYGVYRSAAGTYVEHLVAGVSTFPTVQFNADSSFVGSIDNVSCKEMDVADFNFYRGTNLTATRVGKDGYIEIGNVQFARNTTWADAGDETAPTGWSDFTSGTGTYDVTSIPGQIQFVTDSSSRSILISQSLTVKGNYVLSVTVDKVIAACRIEQVLGMSGNATEVTYFKDGAVVTRTDDVEEGSRYSVWVNKDNTSYTGFRIGIGANGNVEGNITVSKPQIAYGFAPLPYVENTSTSSTKEFGVLSDEPRFDYTGGGCPKLLMEPQRANSLVDSNYFNSINWGELNISDVVDSAHKSPEGILSASKIELPDGSSTLYRGIYSHPISVTSGDKYTLSIFAKQTSNKNRLILTFGLSTDGSNVGFDEPVFNLDDGTITGDSSNASMVDMGDGWWRCIVTSATTTTTDVRVYAFITSNTGVKSFQSTTDDALYLFGAQCERGAFVTSYIPTNYGIKTRTLDGKNSSSDVMVPPEAFDLTGDFGVFFDIGNLDHAEGTTVSSMVMLYLITGTADKNLGLFYNPSNDHGINLHLPSGNGDYVFGSSTNDAAAGDSKMLVTYNATTDRLAYYINGELFNSTTTSLSFDSSTRGYFKANTTADGDEISFEVNQIIFFDNDLSVNDAQLLTLKTKYNSFEEAATKLSYTIHV